MNDLMYTAHDGSKVSKSLVTLSTIHIFEIKIFAQSWDNENSLHKSLHIFVMSTVSSITLNKSTIEGYQNYCMAMILSNFSMIENSNGE